MVYDGAGKAVVKRDVFMMNRMLFLLIEWFEIYIYKTFNIWISDDQSMIIFSSTVSTTYEHVSYIHNRICTYTIFI